MTTEENLIPEVPTGLKLTQVPTIVSLAETTKGIKPSRNILSWKASKNAKSYKIFKAKSRFGKFEEVAETKSTTYIDDDLNATSQFDNAYKIQAINNINLSQLSEATSKEVEMFGKNMMIFTKDDSPESVLDITEGIYEKQHTSQFGNNRYVLAYKQGDYSKDKNLINVGYYTQVLGLGKHPNDVSIYNVHCPAALADNNATCNFWCGIENLSVKDLENNDDAYFDFTWSVSQAAPARRLNVFRKGHWDWYYGWASGGYIADSRFHKQAGSFSQQQYYYRNCQLDTGVYGINWNQVIHGCSGVSKTNSSDNSSKAWGSSSNLKAGIGYTNWDARGCSTIVEKTEVIREKPFLFYDKDSDKYKVFVPALRKNKAGISWSDDSMGEGTTLDVEKSFYIAKPDKDSADSINEQLANGKNIILAPGVFRVKSPIHITKPNTIILGLGLATILPDNEKTGILCDDVGGISIAGVILDAGKYSATMVTVGQEGCNKDHSENPIVLQDVIFRVGGTGELGTCDSCLVINSNDVIVDHTWIWRADHGAETGWKTNKSKNGLIVNGDNVLLYGLFCEHFQEYDILWRGENGKTFFLQNEKAYDPQDQAGWMSHDGTKKGFAAYKVTNNVKKHYAIGLGIYDVFINTGGASIYLDNAIEVPNAENVLIENACTVEIAGADGPKVGINHIINNTGAGIRTGAGQTGGSGYAIQRVLNYCNGTSNTLEDYYKNEKGATKVTESGEKPSDDPYAEKEIAKDASSKDKEKAAWEMTDSDYGKSSVTLLRGKKNIPTFKSPVAQKKLKSAKPCNNNNKKNLFDDVNNTMKNMIEKVNVMINKKIDEKQKKIESLAKKNLKPKDEEKIKNLNAYNEKAKEELTNWTKFVTKHTIELTDTLAQKFKECDDIISPLKGAKKDIHTGIMCDSCGMFPIVGKRFKCSVCPNFDYCEKCENKLGDKHGHPFIVFYKP